MFLGGNDAIKALLTKLVYKVVDANRKASVSSRTSNNQQFKQLKKLKVQES